MDDFLRRLGIAYLGFTAALWAISFCMIMNGSAYPRNPAWGIVAGLRLYFTLPIALALAVAACVGLFWAVLAARECRQMALAARVRAEEARLEAAEGRRRRAEGEQRAAEAMRPRTEEEKRLDSEHAAQWFARQEEAAEAKRREEERQRQEIIERKTRSARTAAERALDDF